MIYRILVDFRVYHCDAREFQELQPEQWHWYLPKPEYQEMVGAGVFPEVMDEHGLRRPTITNKRAKFYFTDRGWEKVGCHVAATARRRGHVVKVLRRKNPMPSQVVYEDELQIAILPPKKDEISRCDGAFYDVADIKHQDRTASDGV